MKKKNIKKTFKEVKKTLKKAKKSIESGFNDVQDELENFDPLKDWDTGDFEIKTSTNL